MCVTNYNYISLFESNLASDLFYCSKLYTATKNIYDQ